MSHCVVGYWLLTINFYDVGGWQIDECEEYQDPTAYPLKSPPENVVLGVFEYGGYDKFTIDLVSEDTSNFKNGHCIYYFEANDPAMGTFYNGSSGSIIVTSKFDSDLGTWKSSVTEDNIVSDWNVIGTWEMGV